MKNSFLFVKNRLKQLGWAHWKHMGFLIKHSKSDMLMKTPSFLVSPVRLKSPINQIQCWDVSLFKIEDKIIKKIFITLWWRFIEANTAHFWVLMENSIKLFRSHRRFLQCSQLYREYFHWFKKWFHHHLSFCPCDTSCNHPSRHLPAQS